MGLLELVVNQAMIGVAEGVELWVVQLVSPFECQWCWWRLCHGLGFTGIFVIGLAWH
jgi:hypothetical protein